MRRACVLLFILCFGIHSQASIGLGTKFGSIVLEKVDAGKTYNLMELRGVPYIIYNSGTGTTDVSIEVIPAQKPRDGYEPMNDPSWLKIKPDRITLKGGDEFPCNMILSIPDDKSLYGRHFHALIRAQTVGEGFFGTAVINNFYFSVGTEGPEAVRKAKSETLLKTLNFDVSPQALYIQVEAGKKVNIQKELGKSVKIINMGEENLKLKIKSVSNVMNYPLQDGYEFTPDLKFLTADPDVVRVKSNRVKDVKLYVNIPDEYKGKKIMFLLAVSPDDAEWSIVKLYVRVYIEIK